MNDKAASANARFGKPVAQQSELRRRHGQNPKTKQATAPQQGVVWSEQFALSPEPGGVVGGIKHEPANDLSVNQQASAAELAQHITGLRRYALLLVGNSVDADDLVQEALTKVLAQLQRWNEVRDLRSYLFTALHNVHIDHTRRNAKFRQSIPIDEAVSLLSTPATQQKRLELRDLSVALGKLPADQREVVLLVGFEGMSYSEAAATLNIPIGTVMSRLSRGREALRQMTNRSAPTKLRVVK